MTFSIVWDRLAEMTDTYGPRVVGSEALEKVRKAGQELLRVFTIINNRFLSDYTSNRPLTGSWRM